MNAPALSLIQVVKSYGASRAVRGVSLDVSSGEFLTILGPSGSGKTTLLKLIAGFVAPTSGSIMIAGRDVSTMAPGGRGIGMVLQHYALFPHLTVEDNVGYPLRIRGVKKADRAPKVAQMLELVGLPTLGRRYPRQLSGGQQQRVALARALAFDPAVLLFDEPLGALDRELRIRMAVELRRVHRETSATMVYVTHDREEAMTLSDRVAIMHDGALEALGTPGDLFQRPATSFVASFFGGHNLLPAVWADAHEPDTHQRVSIVCLGRKVEVVCSVSAGGSLEGPAFLSVPARALRPSRGDASGFGVSGLVQDVRYLGETVLVVSQVAGVGEVTAELSYNECDGIEVGQEMHWSVDTERCVAVQGSST